MRRLLLKMSLLFLPVLIWNGVKAQYCQGGPLNAFDSNIESVTLIGESGTEIDYQGCPGITGVEDQTAQQVELWAGEEYTIVVHFGTCGGNFSNAGSVWIDYNQDEVFQANEAIVSTSGTPGTAPWDGPQSFTFTVPPSATGGVTRIRAMQQEFGSIPLDPCESFAYGSVVDFSADIIPAASTCPMPIALTLTNVGLNEQELSWTEGGTETEWNIEYGIEGFTQGTGTIINTTNLSETIAGLTSSTNYDFYVQAVCGPGDESFWAGPVTGFSGYCEPIYTFTDDYLSLFETTSAQQNITYTATAQPSPNGFANLIGSDTISHFEGGTFDFTTNFQSGSNTIVIWVDWNQDLVFDPSELVYQDNQPGPHNGSITVPVGTPQGDYVMRVRSRWLSTVPTPCSSETYGSAIDLTLNVGNPPNCPPPSDFDIVSTQSTSVVVEWDTLSATSSFALEWGAPGFTPGTGTEIGTSTTTALTDTITGLDPETNYDVYVLADCGGDSSIWVGPLNVFTGYCSPSYNNTTEWITDFETTSGIGNDIVYNSTVFPPNGLDNIIGSQLVSIFAGDDVEFDVAYTASWPNTVAIWVDWNDDLVFDSTELMYYFGSTSHLSSGQFTVPAGTPSGNYVMRVRAAYGSTVANLEPCNVQSWGSAVDMEIEILPAPSCPRPSDLIASNLLPNSADIEWTAGGNETEWELEYGPAGFTPGAGTFIVTSDNPYALAGLDPDTAYEIYVRGICDVGDTSLWRGPSNFMTPCNVFSAPFLEDFDDASVWISGTGFNNVDSEISSCWDRTTDPFQWGTRVGATSSAATGPSTDASGSGKYVFTSSNTGTNGQEAKLWTPLIDLSTINDPRFQFSYHMYGSFVDSLNLFISNDNGATWDSLLTIVGMQQVNKTDAWIDTLLDLSNWANDTVIIEFYNIRTGANDNVAVDELKILPCVPTPGVDGEEDICRLDVTVDLNTIITPAYNYGKWSFPANESLINDNIMNVATLPTGTYEVFYITEGLCDNDTTVATLNIFPPSSAGENGTIEACRNEPLNLFAGLNGNVDMGGTWFDSQGNQLPNSQPTASNIGGSFNYDYIVSNGVCPSDTQFVEVIVSQACDYLSIGEEKLGNISVYPNPATNHVVIANESNFDAMTIEMLDVNGRVVLVDNNSLMNNNQAEITIDHLTPGVYTLRLKNNDGQRTFKIVKQ